MNDTFTIEPGRNIYRNGKPFVCVKKCEGISPVEADDFARAIPEMAHMLERCVEALATHRDATKIRSAAGFTLNQARALLAKLSTHSARP